MILFHIIISTHTDKIRLFSKEKYAVAKFPLLVHIDIVHGQIKNSVTLGTFTTTC